MSQTSRTSTFSDYVPALGAKMHVAGYAVMGVMAETRWRDMLATLAQVLGMTACAEAAQWTYPIEGRGGNGLTIVQPITESFLAVETWPDHGGAYLFVVSCKPFKTATIAAVLREYELDLHAGEFFRLGLRD